MGAAGDGSSCGKERAPELRWRLIPDELSPPPNGGALPLLGMESDGDGRCGEVEELVRAVGGERGEEQEKGAEEHAARRRCGQETYSGGVHRPSSQNTGLRFRSHPWLRSPPLGGASAGCICLPITRLRWRLPIPAMASSPRKGQLAISLPSGDVQGYHRVCFRGFSSAAAGFRFLPAQPLQCK